MFKIFKISALSRATISFGIPAGARTPYQLMTSYPGSPDSAIVGRLGAANERLALVTASAFNLPVFTCGSAGGMLLNINDTLPPRRSVSAGTAPLYGMWTILTPAMVLNSSPARCCGVPLPGEPKVSSPGRDFATTINSLTELAGMEGWTTRTIVTMATSLTGSQSFTLSYGIAL